MSPHAPRLFQLKNKPVGSREVGSLLNVQSFLEGSVRKAGDQMRITVQLIKVSDGFHLWSQTFDRKVADIFAVQEQIARHIVEALSVQLLRGGCVTSEPPGYAQLRRL